MRTIIITGMICLLIGCTNGFDLKKSGKVSRTAVELIKQGKYSELDKMYSDDFKNSESKEAREAKFTKIFHAVGEIKNIELQDSANIKLNANDEVVYKYKIMCAKINVVGYFTIKEENGNYLISGINIEQEK